MLLALSPEEESLRALKAIFEAEQPEPEPPPGLRAPADTRRHRQALEEYEAAMRAWEEAERTRLGRCVALCTRHLEEFPQGSTTVEAKRIRGRSRHLLGDHDAAREDLAFVVAQRPDDGETRGILVTCCRLLGDFVAALACAGPDPEPELLEEAGKIAEAIAAAEKRGLPERATGWRLLGQSLPFPLELPAGFQATVVIAGKRHDEALEAALKEHEGRVARVQMPEGAAAVYLLDSKGIVRAVNPRPETWRFRIRGVVASTERTIVR